MTRRVSKLLLVLLMLAAFSTEAAYSQGVQTGSVTGIVTLADGSTIAGADVVVRSTSLQGERTASTDVNGVYAIASLPPGQYTIKISKEGFTAVEKTVIVPLGTVATVNAALPVAGVSENIVVEGAAPSAIATTQTSAHIVASDVNVMPMGRTPYLLTELMPGVTTNTPVNGQVTISGGFGYDNVFLIDGVDVNDNLLGTSNDLYIEEAIGEVQVLTSGIGAEYGRFSGGVINIITKSGGNNFSGSYRTTFTNPAWTKETPFETTQRANKLSTFSELTAGGPAVKDRLWFFGASRFEHSSTSGALPVSAVPYTKTNNSKRYELKGTGSIRSGHTLAGTYIDNRVHRANEPVLSFSIDKAALISPSTPNHLGVATYNGAVSSKMLVSAQYSQRHFETKGVGSTLTSIVDSPFLTRTGTQYQYNSAYFDATDPEQRNNRQLTGSVSYFASSSRLGSHELKAGGEDFVDTRIGANAQSATGYVFLSNFRVDAAGLPVLDGQGRLIPMFVPGTSRLQRWIPYRGAAFDMRTAAAYVQDRWIASPHVTFNLGMRFEHASSDATAGVSSVKTDRVVPRLGAAYDIKADSRTVVLASYSQYAGKYNDVQFSKNTNVGNSDRYTTVYMGPAGEGREFAPGFDVSNYANVVAGTFPAVNVRFDSNLSSPVTREFTVGAAQMIGAQSYLKASYVQRRATGFVEDFTLFANGTSPLVVEGATVGTTDNVVYANSDIPTREYRAVEFVGQHRMKSVAVNGQWTIQLKNDGNFEGESPNPAGSPVGDYPEMTALDRSAPSGHLDDFQRSKVRVWAIYNVGLGRLGSLDVTPLYRYNSAKTYSLAVTNQPLSAIQAARNPGYANTVLQTIFFGDRGSESFKGYALLDLAATYGVPVWKSARPWVKVQAFNLLNNQKLIAWNTTIMPDMSSPKDENGLPTGYTKSATFGTATSAAHYPAPRAGADGGRTFDVAVGFRF